jgi:hypothetical protein
MTFALLKAGEHAITSSAVSYVNHEENYRNVWTVYKPEGGPEQKILLRCTNPRISDCKNFYIEDIAPVEAPERTLGIAKVPISTMQRENFKEAEILKEFQRRREPTVLILD